MQGNGGCAHNAEADEGAKELEHLQVSGAARRWVEHKAVSVQTMVVPVVGRLDQQG